MAIWEAAANEVLYSAFNQIGSNEGIDSYVATGNFLRDYVSYVSILGIFPHPRIVRNLREVLDDIAKEDDFIRAKSNSKKKGGTLKKGASKRSGVVEESPPPPTRGKSRTGLREPEVKKEEPTVEAVLDTSSLAHMTYSDLEVKSWKLDNGTARAIHLALQNATSLRSFRLYNTEVPDQAWPLLLDAISKNTSLQSLSLEAHYNLAPLLPSLPSTTFSNIQQFSLMSNGIEDTALVSLLENLSSVPGLVALELWDNKITDEGAIAVGMYLRTNTTLTSLSLGKNQIGDAGAEAIATNLGRYALSAEETANRKKLKSDLEFKKKETERKNAATAPATGKKKPVSSLGARDKATKEEATLEKASSARKKVAPVKKEPTLEDQIDTLQPADEIDGLWYIDGNRTLTSINLRMNKLTDAGGAAILRLAEINLILRRCVYEHNLFSDEMRVALDEAFAIRIDDDDKDDDLPDYEMEQPYLYTNEPQLVL